MDLLQLRPDGQRCRDDSAGLVSAGRSKMYCELRRLVCIISVSNVASCAADTCTQYVELILDSLSLRESGSVDDSRQVTFLALLGLSAAFDTVDHDTLPVRLETFGIGGSLLAWLKSSLSHRQQFGLLNGVTSAFHSVVCGVPQGSVLAPVVRPLHG